MAGPKPIPAPGRKIHSKVNSGTGEFVITCEHQHAVGEKVHLLARPLPAESEPNVVRGVVADVTFQQERFKVTFENGFYAHLQNAPQVGDEIEVPVKVECLA